MKNQGIEIGVVGRIEMECGETVFQVKSSLQARKKKDGEDEQIVYQRNESFEVPRLYM